MFWFHPLILRASFLFALNIHLAQHPSRTPCHDYCKKGELSKTDWEADGNKAQYFGLNAEFWEYGCFVLPGTRTDLKKLVEAINEAPNFRAVLHNDEVAGTLARHLNYVRQVFDAKIPKPMKNFKPRPWQAKLLERLMLLPDDRTIIWVCDPFWRRQEDYVC